MNSIENEIKRMKSKLEEIDKVEVNVALFGQPGSGKSSIINKLLGRPLAHVSVKTDATTDKQDYDWKNVFLVDLPGYGTEKFPKKDFFKKFEINKFDLFLCVTNSKFTEADSEFFKELLKIGKVCIFVRNSHDSLSQDGKTTQQLEKEIIEDTKAHMDVDKVVFISCKTNYGLEKLEQEIFNNLDSSKGERWARSAKAYSDKFLQEKKKACKKYILYASGLSALNGINPIPGVDAAIDIGTIYKLFEEIRESYGLDEEYLKKLKSKKNPLITTVLPLIDNVLKYALKEGVLILFKKYASKQIAKQVTKYVPIVGQLAASSLGFYITKRMSDDYLEEIHEIAKQLLESELKKK